MRLELGPKDLKGQCCGAVFAARYEMFTKRVQKAIRLVGKASFLRMGRRFRKVIYPPPDIFPAKAK
jgi:hypothetical protein